MIVHGDNLKLNERIIIALVEQLGGEATFTSDDLMNAKGYSIASDIFRDEFSIVSETK